MRRPSPAMLVAIAALVFAAVGSAAATRALTGGERTKVVVKKVGAGAEAESAAKRGRRGRKGRRGRRGAPGPQGPRGLQGPPGPAPVLLYADNSVPASDIPIGTIHELTLTLNCKQPVGPESPVSLEIDASSTSAATISFTNPGAPGGAFPTEGEVPLAAGGGAETVTAVQAVAPEAKQNVIQMTYSNPTRVMRAQLHAAVISAEGSCAVDGIAVPAA